MTTDQVPQGANGAGNQWVGRGKVMSLQLIAVHLPTHAQREAPQGPIPEKAVSSEQRTHLLRCSLAAARQHHAAC
jgi:hypothetical protein